MPAPSPFSGRRPGGYRLTSVAVAGDANSRPRLIRIILARESGFSGSEVNNQKPLPRSRQAQACSAAIRYEAAETQQTPAGPCGRVVEISGLIENVLGNGARNSASHVAGIKQRWPGNSKALPRRQRAAATFSCCGGLAFVARLATSCRASPSGQGKKYRPRRYADPRRAGAAGRCQQSGVGLGITWRHVSSRYRNNPSFEKSVDQRHYRGGGLIVGQ